MLVPQVTQQHSFSSAHPGGARGPANIHEALTKVNDWRHLTFTLVFLGKLFGCSLWCEHSAAILT